MSSKTKEERLHLMRTVELGCCVCKNLGHPDTVAMIHHIRHGQGMSQRASHFEVLPLCHYHHQGEEGIHTLGRRRWEAKFGTELQLLEQVRAELGR